MRRIPATILSTTTLVFLFFVAAPGEASGATMRKGPYLINPGDTSQMQVLWQLDQIEGCTLEWGTDTTYGLGNINTAEYGIDHQHSYTIPSLTPGTKYFYRVTVSGNDFTGSFHAAPETAVENIKFFAYGDTRTYPASHDTVAGGMISSFALDPDYQTFVLVVGDLVSEGREEADWDEEFFDPQYVNIQTMLANLPYHSCMGNHETSGSGGDLFLKYFPYPYVSDHYWSFDYGPVHFVVVDQYVDYGGGSTQLAWIESDLASSTKPWKIICLHEPGWSAGGHSNDKTVQNYIQPLCEKYGVQIVFGGHNHYYARAVKNGVQHVTTGGGGAPLYDPNPGFPNVVAASKSHHYCKVHIEGDILAFSAVKPDGTEIDSFVLDNSILFVDDDNISGPWYGSFAFPFQHIQDGIDAAVDGETVSVAPGIYEENIHFQGKAITVRSSGGPDRTIINGENPANPDYGSAVLFDGGEGPDSMLLGFTITKGTGTSDSVGGYLGGGICCIASSPTIRGNSIFENTASYGGGISVNAGSSPAIINNTLHANAASFSGGGMWISSDSIPFIASNTFTGNTAASTGGGVDCGSGTPTIKNTILWSNAAPVGQEINGLNAVVTYCDIRNGWPGTGNIDADPLFVSGPLGLFYLSQPPCQPLSSPCLDTGDPGSTMIEGTTRTDGVQDAGIVDMGYHHLDRFLRVPDDFTTIQAAVDAALDWDRIMVSAGTYVENINFHGKAISLIGQDGAASTIIDGNQAGSVVKFKSDEGPNSILKGFTITNGLAAKGGGINCGPSSFPIITENIVTGNSATKDGGGMFRGKTVSSCTISGNDAASNGGGIFGAETIENSIIQGNTANLGGGVYDAGNIINSTVYGNSAVLGGGIASPLSTVSMKNSIFWNNTATIGQQIYGNASVDYCDIQGGWAGTGNIDNDPLFVDSLNGDLHLTYPSPCKDTGDNSAVTVSADFDGDPRIAYGTVDMGADEFYPHLYYTGDAKPGGYVEVKIIGLPGPNHITLFAGSGVLDPCWPTQYGNWYLQLPIVTLRVFSEIPYDGVIVLPSDIPPGYPYWDIPLQTMVGDQLTNLCVMEVE